jgi:hypothetical protein
MKTRILPGWVLGMMLAGGVIAPGFSQDSPDLPPTPEASNKAGAAITPAPAPTVPGTGGDQSLPSNVQLSPYSLDIQRLAQAQVDEAVILAYVTNSAGIFNLTADQIIHLKKAGVAPQVVNAMIQHDQEVLSGARPLMAAATPPPPAESQIVANDASWDSEVLIPEDDYYAPEQPESIGPVRAPYPVKLNDPIVILKLPSFAVPYW